MALRVIAARGGVARLQSAVPRVAGVVPAAGHQLRSASRAACCRALAGHTRQLSTIPHLVGADPAPSAKALQFAHNLAEQYNVLMPEEAKSSAVLCSAFIDEVLDANPNPPTEKQLAYATKLCAERGQELPPEARADRRKCSKLIDELLGNAPAGGDGAASSTDPSDKQILFAARLAREKGMGLSAEALASKTAMSALIDELSAAPGGAASMGWQPAAPASPVAPYPPPLEQRDQENKGRYPY